MDTAPHANSWMDVVMYLIFVAAPIAATLVAQRANRNASEAKRVSQDIHTTLTQKNGGSAVKDQLDRIESHLDGTPLTTEPETGPAPYPVDNETVTKPVGE